MQLDEPYDVGRVVDSADRGGHGGAERASSPAWAGGLNLLGACRLSAAGVQQTPVLLGGGGDDSAGVSGVAACC
ncbi:hypothetical protein [Micromonospora chokoriensis]|uniref:hypothetical protein n=1 Tax=Micromonospora chokoriensis TaxID=356851 RepID=UPI0012FD29AA|nr:hypothetical protein [Micromonospora chokoriensis]